MKTFADLRSTLNEAADKKIKVKGQTVTLKPNGKQVDAYMGKEKLGTFKDAKAAAKEIEAFLDQIK